MCDRVGFEDLDSEILMFESSVKRAIKFKNSETLPAKVQDIISVWSKLRKGERNQLCDNRLLEAYAMLKELYGNEYLSRRQVFEWFKRFKEGRVTAEDDPRPGLITKKLIREDRRLNIRGLAEIAGIYDAR
ncbi:hypothetical protein NQ318_003707 [Aromia moschata]|uniref:Mos1 transposase HTH domain-containing protein n=1 Tax=Aromia moschata TaxID=1265417 RepID=A0AAV8YH53_9CUCU|nr:hypothetical protein NQ318_003707 [Aromia moschata]